MTPRKVLAAGSLTAAALAATAVIVSRRKGEPHTKLHAQTLHEFGETLDHYMQLAETEPGDKTARNFWRKFRGRAGASAPQVLRALISKLAQGEKLDNERLDVAEAHTEAAEREAGQLDL